MRVLVLRHRAAVYCLAALTGLLLAVSLWPWVSVLTPNYAPVFAPAQGGTLGPLLLSAERAETAGSVFWMLLLKGGLPAYQALGERAYWIELLEYTMDRVITHEPHRVLAMGISGLAAVEFAPDVSPITISPDIPPTPAPSKRCRGCSPSIRRLTFETMPLLWLYSKA
ncbi:MAG: hypothetical protein DDT37_01526 [Firmicutes bacterium]|nr:hypothetical protein [candidate division NPL-UPA2 bacterium]